MSTPILIAALGEIFAERSGVINLGVEGIMLMGAFTTFAGTYFLGSPWIGLLAGILTGAVMGLLMAFLTVTLTANQIVCGLVITLLGTGLSSFLSRVVFGMFSTPPIIQGLEPIHIPVLGDIPVLGSVLFQHNALVYFSWLLIPVLYFMLFRTSVGLAIRASGENPDAAAVLGVHVKALRYVCVIFGGMMAGLAGGYLSLDVKVFQDYMTGGRGWMAVTLVILGDWEPFRTLAASILFGGALALQFRFQAIAGGAIPAQIWNMAPYIVTLVALVMYARRRTHAEKCTGRAKKCTQEEAVSVVSSTLAEQ